MFSKIIKSEARKAILQLLIQNSRQKYYLRELASMIQYSPGSLQRELNSLIESGFIVSEKMGNLRFFSLNPKCPFLKELKIYLSQHAAPKQTTSPENKPQGIAKPSSQSEARRPSRKKSRPVLEQDISKNPTPVYFEKQDKIDESSTMPIQAATQVTIHPDTQVTTPATIPEPARPITPFSHIEPPTFSRPVLHKPYLEKPRFEPVPPSSPGSTYAPLFQPIEPEIVPQPPHRNFDIQINIPPSPGGSDENEPPAASGTGTDIEIHIK